MLGIGASRSLTITGTIGSSASTPIPQSGMQVPWSSFSRCDSAGSKSCSSAVSSRWRPKAAWPLSRWRGNTFCMNGSGGPSCSSPMPMQTAGRLSMKKLTQWSGETTTRRAGRQAGGRRPTPSKAPASLSRWSRAIVSQSRAMIGPWLAANAPTRLAMDALLGLERVQPGDELVLRHAADLEIKAQQVGVDQRRERADVVLLQRLAELGLDRVALEHGRHVDAIFRRELRVVLQIEEQLAHLIIRHRRSLARFATARRRRYDLSLRPSRWRRACGPHGRRMNPLLTRTMQR